MKTITISHSSFVSYATIVTGSFLFCAKGILVKELFSHGFNAEEILTLRIITALPFYAIAGVILWKSWTNISRSDFIWIIMFSLIGFCLCSWINFMGLEHVSVGLERVILFSYPSLVLLGGIIFQNQEFNKVQFMACILTWIGLILVVADEVSFAGDKMTIIYGSFLIFLSALIYACYLLCARPVIKRVGANTSTTLGMNISCLIIISYYYFTNNGIEISGEWTSKTIACVLGIGIFGTVAPTYLLSIGLSRVSSSSYAIVSSLGPISTIILAAFMAKHIPSITQVIGMVLALVSSLTINLKSN